MVGLILNTQADWNNKELQNTEVPNPRQFDSRLNRKFSHTENKALNWYNIISTQGINPSSKQVCSIVHITHFS